MSFTKRGRGRDRTVSVGENKLILEAFLTDPCRGRQLHRGVDGEGVDDGSSSCLWSRRRRRRRRRQWCPDQGRAVGGMMDGDWSPDTRLGECRESEQGNERDGDLRDIRWCRQPSTDNESSTE